MGNFARWYCVTKNNGILTKNSWGREEQKKWLKTLRTSLKRSSFPSFTHFEYGALRWRHIGWRQKGKLQGFMGGFPSFRLTAQHYCTAEATTKARDLLTGRVSSTGVKWVSILQFYWLFFCPSCLVVKPVWEGKVSQLLLTPV